MIDSQCEDLWPKVYKRGKIAKTSFKESGILQRLASFLRIFDDNLSDGAIQLILLGLAKEMSQGEKHFATAKNCDAKFKDPRQGVLI